MEWCSPDHMATIVSHNNLSRGYVSGLDVVDSSSSNLTKNYITGGKVGISLRGSHSCNVSGNICLKNERAGIFGEGAYQNLLASNNLSENGNGILLQGSLENSLTSNQAYRNIYGISLRGCTKNMLRENVLRENSYNLRVEAGQGRSGSSNHDFFVQDIDQSNLADNKPICYLVGKADLMVPTDCGFLGLVSCKNIRAANLTIKNSSTGVLLVNSTNCNIQNSSISWAEKGFLLLDSLACTISRCRALDCKTGFAAEGSSGCQFAYDLARNCSAEGFRADDAQGLGLLECEIQSCQSGIALHGSRLCRIQNCSTSKNQEDGVLLSKSHNCSLIGNAAFSNDRGISLTGSNSCFLQANNASANKIDGISLQQLLDADVQSNIALRNGQGIYVQSSRRLNLTGNILGENSRFGLRMSSSKDSNITENNIYDNQIAGANLVDCIGNLLYHNIFAKNGFQNAADNGQNQWDGGPSAGGNYWSDHEVLGNPGRCAAPNSRGRRRSLSFPGPVGVALMDQKDLDLLKIAQDGVQLTSRPYQVLGDLVGISEQEVIERLRALQEAGIIRRFAATIGHRALGIVANAMIAWKAAPEDVERAGVLFASVDEVTHCYERATAEDWPYNLYTMVHSKSRDDCLKIADQLSKRSGISDYKVLFSDFEYKKTSARI